MAYGAYIFDLDGTVLDTLPDLIRLTNMVLQQHGWPQRTREEILSYVGDGGRMLLRRAAPGSVSDLDVQEAFSCWQDLYPTFGHAMTKPYAGMPEALAELKARGAKLGVLSNKFDAAARDVIAHHYPGVFDMARGECAEFPRKPDPTGLRRMLETFGVEPRRCAYVGDSGTDMAVARAAGAFAVAVSWGYRPVQELLDAGADAVIDRPDELMGL